MGDPLLLVTRDWIDRVERAMTDAKLSRAEVARRVGCSKASITQLLAGQAKHSRLVAPICEVLGLALPDAEVSSEEWQQWLELGQSLTRRQRSQVARLVKDLRDNDVD